MEPYHKGFGKLIAEATEEAEAKKQAAASSAAPPSNPGRAPALSPLFSAAGERAFAEKVNPRPQLRGIAGIMADSGRLAARRQLTERTTADRLTPFTRRTNRGS